MDDLVATATGDNISNALVSINWHKKYYSEGYNWIMADIRKSLVDSTKNFNHILHNVFQDYQH